MLAWETSYRFRETIRLGYGWDNPNHAAAVIATLIPCCWGMATFLGRDKKKPAWRVVCWTCEAVLAIALALTFSRGGMLAVVVALVAYGMIHIRHTEGFRRAVVFVGARLALVVALMVITGLGSRFALAAQSDKAVTNRLDLWTGGLHLINVAPWTGWGKGDSGPAYMQWLQDPSATAMHGGMVSSYLHTAVEFGLPVSSALVLWLVGLPVIGFMRGSRFNGATRDVVVACAAALVAFAIANVFTTLWVFPSVVALPVALGIALISMLVWRDPLRQLMIDGTRAVALAAAYGALLYGASTIAAGAAVWRLGRLADGGIVLARRNAAPQADAIFLIDRRTLGTLGGKELRKTMAAFPFVDRFLVYPGACVPSRPDSGPVIAFGARANEGDASRRTVFFPSVPAPSEDDAGAEMLVLSDYDEIGFQADWRRWAEARGIPILTLPQTGQDARRGLQPILARVLK